MDSPPVILYLLDYTDLGGGETSFLALIEQLLRLAPHVRPVVVLPGTGPVNEALDRLGVQTYVIPYPRLLRRGMLPAYQLTALGRVGALIRRLSPVIVHAYTFFGMPYAGPPARLFGIPLVWTCHGTFEIDRPAKRWAARLFASHILCVTEEVRRRVLHYIGRPGVVSTDYLGIQQFIAPAGDTDLRATVRSELGVDPEAPLIGVIGRFQPVKGHRHLLDALPAIRQRLPGLRVWLIGDALFGSEEEKAHKQFLQDRVRAEGIGDCVRFLGFRADARRLIRALDALVIPSEYESFSMVAAEGLEAGVPVIGPDAGGPREVIDVPRTGLLFEPANPASLGAKVLDALLREGEGAAFDPEIGPRRVRELFTAEARIGRIMRVYRKLSANPLD